MPTYQFSNSAADLNTKHSFQTQTVSDRLDNQLSQSVALILLDKNYEQVESNALYALTHLMKDYLLEIGTEIKQNAELQGRTEANLCDFLNTAYDYGATQETLQEHFKKGELTLIPMQQHLSTQKQILNQRS
jgi:hypothetical protein